MSLVVFDNFIGFLNNLNYLTKVSADQTKYEKDYNMMKIRCTNNSSKFKQNTAKHNFEHSINWRLFFSLQNMHMPIYTTKK